MENDHIILRAYIDEDYIEFIELFKESSKEYFNETDLSSQNTKRYFRQNKSGRDFIKNNTNERNLAIALKETNKLIGELQIIYYENIKKARIGYLISSEYRNNGLAYAAVNMLINQLTQKEYETFELLISENNVASINLANKLGFDKTGFSGKKDIYTLSILEKRGYDMENIELLEKDYKCLLEKKIIEKESYLAEQILNKKAKYFIVKKENKDLGHIFFYILEDGIDLVISYATLNKKDLDEILRILVGVGYNKIFIDVLEQNDETNEYKEILDSLKAKIIYKQKITKYEINEGDL